MRPSCLLARHLFIQKRPLLESACPLYISLRMYFSVCIVSIRMSSNSTRLLPYIRISQTMSGAKLHASRTSTWPGLLRTARRSYDTRNKLHRSFLENPDYIRKTTTSELYHWRHARALRNSVAYISSQITWTTHARSWSKQLYHSISWSELITKYTLVARICDFLLRSCYSAPGVWP